MPSLEAYYREKSPTYDIDRFDLDEEVDEHCNWFFSKSSMSQKKLVELGCGTARYTLKLKTLGYDVLGIDLNKDQLKVAQNKVPTLKADASNVPLASNSFSIACFIMMLQQIPSERLEAVLKETDRLLAKNSEIWIKTCSKEDLKKRPFNQYFESAFKINENRYPDIEVIQDFLNTRGFVKSAHENWANHYALSGEEIVRRVEAKHNSTLHLLPEREFIGGLRKIRTHYQNQKRVSLSHHHSLLLFSREA